MTHHWLDDLGFPVGWVLLGFGSIAGWLADHGMTGLSAVALCTGVWMQWETLRIRKVVARKTLGLKPGERIE